jgi:2-oxoglutarate ferredoxin oxidoreductase subunit gamma
MKKANESIISAGFGGQGVIVLGKFLANCGMYEGYNVTWLPSYGVEVRGGTAYSSVRISSSRVGSPVIENPNAAIIMNQPSLEKFEGLVEKDGLLILNVSLAHKGPKRRDIRIIKAPLTDMALGIGNMKVANIVAAGIYAAVKGILFKKTLLAVIETMSLGNKKLLEENVRAIELGMEFGYKYV